MTGWFRHWRGEVWDLRVQGEGKPIGVTRGHPFWSVDRNGWVAVGELQEGERLQAWDGSTPVVQSLTLRDEARAGLQYRGRRATTATGSGSRGCWCIMRRL